MRQFRNIVNQSGESGVLLVVEWDFVTQGGVTMPTFDSYWLRLQVENPGLADGENTLKITVASLRKTLEKSYNQGDADHAKAARDFAALDPDRTNSIFGSIFGDLRK